MLHKTVPRLCADSVLLLLLLLCIWLQVMQQASLQVLLGGLLWRQHVKWAASKCCWVSQQRRQ
jgi:hypothetical protein